MSTGFLFILFLVIIIAVLAGIFVLLAIYLQGKK
jgi:hypothetical protein